MSARATLISMVEETARAAGATLLEHYNSSDLVVDLKGVADLVTSADRAAEALVLSRIRKTYPEHRVLAEESGLHSGSAAARWYVDPLDGTLNFASRLPFWCTSLAVDAAEMGRIGVVYAPLLNEYFSVVAGQGVTLNGQPILARRVNPSDALIYTPYRQECRTCPGESLAICAYLVPRVRRLRMLGSIALALAYVAAGRLDGVVQIGVSAWDFMAGVQMVEENGGVVSDPSGGPLRPDSAGVVAAATPALLHVLLDGILSAQQAQS